MSERTSLNIGSSLRLIAVMVLWAACFPLITIGLDLVPHLAFAALRAALAGLCMIALGALCGRSIPVGGRSWVLIVVVGLGATSMGFLGMFHAAEFVPRDSRPSSRMCNRSSLRFSRTSSWVND